MNPPTNPDVHRQLKDRLLNLSPRAFELFAGDLLEYIGLQNIAVTRYIGDGGIDAHGELIASSSLVRVPTGVQVKRHRANVRRPDIDQFIGALGGRYHHGIFITTADYAPQARAKATTSPIVRIDTVSGDQVAALMVHHSLGITATGVAPTIDNDYFLVFEAQAHAVPTLVREANETYQTSSEDDLISLRALSYALHVEASTIRRGWVETGKLTPDATQRVGTRDVYFFRRERIDAIRQQFQLGSTPQTGEEWRQTFLDYAKSHSLTRSYKPVLLKALLALVDRDGVARLSDLAQAFKAFYVQRWRDGLPTEFGASALVEPEQATLNTIQKLIIKHPLERFILNNFLEFDAENGIIRFTPHLWQELRYYELLDILTAADEQLHFYYQRAGA